MAMNTTHRGSENGNRYSPSGREVLTRSGIMIDVTKPKPHQIVLADIAVSLAHQERFTGHCPLRPTVAQHSLAVEWIAGMLFQKQHAAAIAADPLDDRWRAEDECRREALMHDAPEMLVSDLNGAVKKLLRPELRGVAARGSGRTHGESEFDKLETLAEGAIVERFGLTSDWGAVVHEADCLACAYEMAWSGWCTDAHPPRWVAESEYVQGCYVSPDGGERAFMQQANFLGLR